MKTSTLAFNEPDPDQTRTSDNGRLSVDRLCLDAQTARTAQRTLVGWSELDLQACLGAPDERSTLGDTDILTYYGNSTSNRSFSLGLPFLGGVNLAGGGSGYCHAIFRVKDGHLAEVRYSGETNATLAPDAYCAPIVRGCVQHPEHLGAPATLPTPEAPPGAVSTSQQDEYDCRSEQCANGLEAFLFHD